MEQFHTVPVGNEKYAVIAIDPDARTVRWVKPEQGKALYKSRQAAAWHREREEKKMGTKLSHWIGQEGLLFERVCLVFEGLGYLPPAPDATTEGNATGAYASNIEAQYRANFTADEILQIIEFAKVHSLDAIKDMARFGGIDRELVLGERS